MSASAIEDRAKRRRQEVFVWLAAIGALIGVYAGITFRAARQWKLDKALLDAVVNLKSDSAGQVERLLALGADPNSREASPGVFDSHTGDTALIWAANVGNVAAMKVLLDHGADVNARTWNNCTALMRAAASTSPEAVRVLLDRGANATCKDREGHTALYWAKTWAQATGSAHAGSAAQNHVIAVLTRAEQAAKR